MDTETNLADAPEVEDLPVEQEEQADDTIELDEHGNPVGEPGEDGENIDAGADGNDDDLAEVEIEGKTYKVPKDAALRQADYTRKTQELAAQRQEVEAALSRINEVNQEEVAALSHIAGLDQRLAEFSNIDWDTWDIQDPVSAQRAWRQFSMLKEQRGAALSQYQQARQNASLIAEQEAARRIEQGMKVVSERIPNWSKDTANAILDFGASAGYGFTRDEIAALDDPRAILVLHDAMQFRAMSQKQKTVQKVQAQQAIRPAARVTGGKTAVKPLSDRASIDDWVKARNEQVAKRNR